MNDELEAKLPEFVSYRIGHGDSISTAERRARRIKTLQKSIDVFRPDMNSIYKYIEQRQRNGIKKKSLRIEMMDLEHWFAFLGIRTTMPRLKKEPSPPPTILTHEQVNRIIHYCGEHFNKEVWFRNKVIIEVLAFTGVRIGELERMNLEDVRDGKLYVRSEKMERDRLVPLPGGLQDDLREYVEKYRMHSDSRALFTTDKGRMNYAYLRSFIRKLGAKVGIRDLHAHMFRHFYASELYRLTGDIRLVQILVGHARIETTTIYEHITSEETVEKGKSAVEKLFRGGEDLNQEDQKYVGALAKRWEHWDLNPDLRVSLRVIAPVNHQDQMTHI
jgi:site-specific recombinase XerD